MGICNRAKNALLNGCRLMSRIRNRDLVFLGLEFCICVGLLAVFSLAYPDRYRSKLWENGGVEGWNSNPNLRVLFYANHKEPPEIPFIWTQRFTDSNLALAILTFIIHATRLILLAANYLPLWIATGYDFVLVILWAMNVSGQASGDYSDLDHPSPHPWYLTHTCHDSWVSTKGFCQQAQAGFALSTMAIVLYLCFTASHLLDYLTGWRGRHMDEDEFCDWDDDIESKFSDTDTLLESEERYVAAIQEAAFSPVLAFFPGYNKKGGWY